MAEKKTNSQPVLDERFIITIKGREFVLYAGLLDLAHKKGLRGIHVEALQYPTKENGMEGICKAIMVSKDGDEYIEIGDANPKNVNAQIADHVLRMAATRAKARCLRDYTNIGMTCLEELGEVDEVIGTDDTKKVVNRKKATKRTLKAKPSDGEQESKDSKKPTPVTSISTDHPKMSQAQKTAILNLSKRRGIDEAELNTMVEEAYGAGFDQLSSKDAAQFIRSLQQAA